MANDEKLFSLAAALGQLKPKDKAPRSAHVLTVWITQAENQLHSDGGRLGWLVASTVVTAALQAVVDSTGESRFLLKGGTMLQYRLPGLTRTTTDVDGLVRCDLDDFLTALDPVLHEPWGPIVFNRGKPEVIDVPHKLIKPRRFDLTLSLNGVVWRRIHVEVSPDEGNAGLEAERIAPPSLAGFGLPTPDHLVTLALRYQIAQKVHAATDPHDPPAYENDRARDVVDLLLLRDLARDSGHPLPPDIRAAIVDTFDARAAEAAATGRAPRPWPARLVAYRHWETSYKKAAESAGVTLTLEEAAAEVNAWLDEIDAA